jgi:3-dehydroquinate synthase
MPTVSVKLNSRSYEILVERGILGRAGDFVQAAGLSGHAALITDANVALHYSERVKNSLEDAGYKVSVHLMPPGENSKTMHQVQLLCRSLIEHHHDRASFVVALGGGVVGDVAGFVAAIFHRGIPYVQIPTSIVAQVDSSIGGKTGVNEPEGKNLIGAFHQPCLVLVDPDTLLTLPIRVFREGFAEVIKHAAIRDAVMLGRLESMDPDRKEIDPDLIARNAGIKARIVEQDERETSGTRALLNFGHTIGHALEASSDYGALLHGEAIALGIRAALYLSERVAGLNPDHSARLVQLLRHWKLPLVLDPGFDAESIRSHLARDKKFAAGKMRFVLLPRLGDAIVSEEVTDDLIREALEYIRTPVESGVAV